MIFRQWEDVLAGRKTQTRRIVKPGEACRDGMSVAKTWSNVVLGTTGHRAWEPYYLKWQVGRTYAVQPGRGKKAVGRIRITEIRRERLQEITAEDVKAEGLISVEALANLWDEAIKTVQRTQALEALSTGDYQTAFSIFWDVLIHGGRPATRWQDNPETWVLSFEIAQRA